MHGWLGVGSIAVVVLAIGGMTSTGCERPPRALDPLTPAEKRDAERIARADPQVFQPLLNGRTELVYSAFFTIKPGPGGDRDPDHLVLERAAEIVFYRFDGDFGIRAIVNLSRKTVVSVQRLESADVPLSQRDWTDALRLALNDADVKKMLGDQAGRFARLDLSKSNAATLKQNAVRSLLFTTADPNDPCYRSRCVQLLFRQERTYLVDSAIVNLSTGMVRIRKGKTP